MSGYVKSKEFNERELMSGSEVGKKTFALINSKSGKVQKCPCTLQVPELRTSPTGALSEGTLPDSLHTSLQFCCSYKDQVCEGLLVLLRLYKNITSASPGLRACHLCKPLDMNSIDLGTAPQERA